MVTIGVAFILFTLATGGVKGFAFMLGIGTIVSLFTAVLATSAILGALSWTAGLLQRPSALGVGKTSKGWSFDFMGSSRWFFSASGIILAAGAIAIATLGLNFGIDFESGPASSPARAGGQRGRDPRHTRPAGLWRRQIQRSTTRSWAATWSRSRSPSWPD